MANRRKLFFDWLNKSLLVSDAVPRPYALPKFIQYETVGMDVVILEPDPNLEGNFNRLDIDNVSLTVTLNDTLDDASPLVQQATWTKNLSTNTFSGDVALNTAAFNTFMDADSKTAWLEVEIAEGSQKHRVYLAQVTCVRGVAQDTSTAPAPVTEYLTVAQGTGMFVQFNNEAGASILLKSQDGLHGTILYTANDGTFKADYVDLS